MPRFAPVPPLTSKTDCDPKLKYNVQSGRRQCDVRESIGSIFIGQGDFHDLSSMKEQVTGIL